MTEMSAYDANALYNDYVEQMTEQGKDPAPFGEWLKTEGIVPSYRLSFKD